MAGELEAVVRKVYVFSSGDEDGTRREGFRSLVLLDEKLAASSAFGAGGTPMGVLVDADGRIASEVVAGAEAVLNLARSNGPLMGNDAAAAGQNARR